MNNLIKQSKTNVPNPTGFLFSGQRNKKQLMDVKGNKPEKWLHYE